MAGEPRPGPTQPGQKRQQGTAISCSNYDLDYKLYREDVPYRVYECQRIPPLINRVPVKIRRTQVGMGIKSSCSPHKGPRKSHLPQEQIKLQTEELHSIRGELSQIKAQVDRLLETLERMDQQRDQLLGHAPPTGGPACTPRSEASEENRALVSKRSSCRNTEAKQEPRGQRPHPEADSPEDSTDPEEAVSGPAPPLILTLPAFESLWPPCEQGRDSGLCGSPQWWLRGDTGLLPQASPRTWALHCVVSHSQLGLDELSWTREHSQAAGPVLG
ncbi:heterogeneous nuclear ribonucleoprotein C-like isoform X6 [Lynx canadensis]|uniref:heterogeneous nuclear ribonucleoprotein C-like isoform X6 n=1 Tax=Lynx canadensis TaxID=61383 RepID=UPI0011B0A7CD|nr:heterogeneous nuclear ribonucleoprotein C-like isoform X6 [Lynx canadensis]